MSRVSGGRRQRCGQGWPWWKGFGVRRSRMKARIEECS